ncbi:DUF3397 domain-containing protein [Bacillaceae bacterium IKA-2]|nr:DUF3397 domain-containing protein [Bacillaceae bacterium IKA-2]
MSSAVAWLLATLITLPLLAFYLMYIITVKTIKNKKIAIKRSVDLSTILFIVAVYFIAYEIWSISLFWFVLITIISVAIIFTIIHWKYSNDIHLSKLLKGIWRLNFILFFLVYIILSIYGLLLRISQMS